MEHYDIIVVGGGPSGVAAAIAAARGKTNVLLIEKCGYLGGLASNASVPAFCPFTDGKNTLIGGIGMEILMELKEISFESPFYDCKPDRIQGIDWFPIDTEALKITLDSMVLESGCKLLFHTSVIACEREKDRIKTVTIFNKSGIQKLSAHVFIDCTGDADLTAMAGGSFAYGDEQGQVQAGTLCFKIANFDVERFMEYAKESGEDGNLNIAVRKAAEDGTFPLDEQKVAGMCIASDGMASFNFGHVYGISPLDTWNMTKAEVEARKKLPKLMKFIHDYVPGAERAVLAYSGPEIGTRESRRICGEYCLTEEDYRNRKDFEDNIAYYSYPIDMHASRMEQVGQSEKRYQESRYSQGEAYGIPYGSLLHREISNLLTAGRTISCDRAMQASIRVMPACFATGHAAGCAAALSKNMGTGIKKIDISQLRKVLSEQGAVLRRKTD